MTESIPEYVHHDVLPTQKFLTAIIFEVCIKENVQKRINLIVDYQRLANVSDAV